MKFMLKCALLQKWKKFFPLKLTLLVVAAGFVIFSGHRQGVRNEVPYVFGPIIKESLSDYRYRVEHAFPSRNDLLNLHLSQVLGYVFIIFSHPLDSQQIAAVLAQEPEQNNIEHKENHDRKNFFEQNFSITTGFAYNDQTIRLVQADYRYDNAHNRIYFTGQSISATVDQVLALRPHQDSNPPGSNSFSADDFYHHFDDGITSLVAQMSLEHAINLRQGALIYSVEIAPPNSDISQTTPVVNVRASGGM